MMRGGWEMCLLTVSWLLPVPRVYYSRSLQLPYGFYTHHLDSLLPRENLACKTNTHTLNLMTTLLHLEEASCPAQYQDLPPPIEKTPNCSYSHCSNCSIVALCNQFMTQKAVMHIWWWWGLIQLTIVLFYALYYNTYIVICNTECIVQGSKSMQTFILQAVHSRGLHGNKPAWIVSFPFSIQ